MGFPSGSGIKNPSAMQDTQEMWVWSPGGEHGNPFQYSCLENSMDRGAWQATVYRVAKSQTRLKQLSTHVSLTECFLDTGLWCWCFMWMNSLIHTALYKVVTTVIPFYHEESEAQKCEVDHLSSLDCLENPQQVTRLPVWAPKSTGILHVWLWPWPKWARFCNVSRAPI